VAKRGFLIILGLVLVWQERVTLKGQWLLDDLKGV